MAMKYELDDLDIKNLIVIIDQATITGKMAETIVQLKTKLRTPINEDKCSCDSVPADCAK